MIGALLKASTLENNTVCYSKNAFTLIQASNMYKQQKEEVEKAFAKLNVKR
jgi:hypothetical protein